MEKQASKSVVGDVKIPKLKMNGKRAAYVNAAAVAIATYFGIVAIFGAIAGFTNGDWTFSMPTLVTALFSNASFSFLGVSVSVGPSVLFITAMLALIGGVIGFFTLKKLTDASAVKSAWALVAEIFGVVTGLLVVALVSTAIWSLLGIGEKANVSQGDLWLSVFLPTFIKTALAAGIYMLARKIAAGKLEVLRIFGMVATGIAVVAFVLVLIQTLVGFYGKKPSSSSLFDDDYDWSNWLD